MIKIVLSETFRQWLKGMRDHRTRSFILARVKRLRLGNFGDAVHLGSGIIELRIHFGPGYRIYCMRQGIEIVILLCAGDKSSQKRDILTAMDIAREWRQ